MKFQILRAGIVATGFAATIQPALALTTISGSGAVDAARIAGEAVTIFTTFQPGHLAVHIRNVGPATVTIVLTPQCSGSCGSALRIRVSPVGGDGDSSQDQVVALPGSAQAFSWTISA